MPRRKSSIWEHCELTDGNNSVKCNYCLKLYGYRSATRMEEHMANCEKCPSDLRQKYSKIVSPMSRPTSSSSVSNSTVSIARPNDHGNVVSTTSTSVDNLPNKDVVDKINAALARAVYASNLPLSLFESPYWKSAIKAINEDYIPPNKYAMSNTLLNAEYVRVKEDTDRKLQKSTNLGLVTDGWTNICSQGVVNFLVTTPKPIFIKCIYPGTNRETAEFIKTEICKVIEDIGAVKFSCIITDNASAMKAAWTLIETKYPYIDCVGCAAHALNLLCKDILSLECFNTLFKNCKKIILQIKKTHTLLALFEQKQNEQYGVQARTLKIPSATRWAGAYLAFESLIENQEALQALSISREANMKTNMKKYLMTDETWIHIENAKKLLAPIANYIAKIESDDSVLSDVVQAFVVIKNSISSLEVSDFLTTETKNEILNYCESRRSFSLKPIHLAAYLIDPIYHPFVNNKCVNLNDDEYYSATHFISKVADILSIDNTLVFQNLAEYRARSQFWSNDLLWSPIVNMENNSSSSRTKLHPRDWWLGLCHSKPLSAVAIRILSNPPTSAASERNWSLFGRTHTKDRNRLSADRLNKLIFVNWNLKFVNAKDGINDITTDEPEDVQVDDCNSDIEL